MFLTRKQKTIAIIAIIFVFAFALSGFFYFKDRLLPGDGDQLTNEELQEQLAELSFKATEFETAGDIDKALSAYDDTLTQVTEPEVRASLLVDKALIAFRNERLSEALEYAKEANTLNATPNSLSLTGAIVRRQGDDEMALDYYRQALAAYEAQSMRDEPEEEAIKAIIAELSGEEGAN